MVQFSGTEMRHTRLAFLVPPCLVLAPACGSSGNNNTGAPADAGPDAITEEAGPDVAADVAPDRGGPQPEAGREGGPDATTDASDGSTCASWSRLEDGLSGGAILDAEFDPRTPGLAYAVGSARVFTSTDSAATWKTVGTTPFPVHQLVFPKDQPNVILGASDGGLLASTDGGATWSVRALGGEGLTALFDSPALPQRMYVGIGVSGISRSDDGGFTWTGINNGLPYGSILALSGDPTQPDVLLASMDVFNNGVPSGYGDVARTSDGGMTWTLVSQNTKDPLSLATCGANPSMVYAAIRSGLAVSSDGGQTFPQQTLQGKDVVFVTLDATCQNIYATVFADGVYASSDRGMTWTGPLNNGLQLTAPTYAHPLVTSPTDGTRVLAASSAGLFLTTTSGTSWSPASGVVAIAAGPVSVSPLEPGKLWMATSGTGVWMRPSPTMPWQNVTAVNNAYAFTVLADPSNAGRVFAGTQPGLYMSTDDGQTFSDAYAPENIMAIAPDPTDPHTIYMGGEANGVFKSTDVGQTWAQSNGSLQPWPTPVGNFIWITAMLVDPTAPSHVFIGTYGRGIYQSTDAAASWNSVAPAAAMSWVTCLTRGAGSDNALYACVDQVGILRSTDAGSTWTVSNTGLSALDVRGLAVDPMTTDLYALTAHEGVFQSADHATWSPFDPCQPGNAFGSGIAVVTNGQQRTLVVTGGGGVLTNAL
jgi:photosystem II stability/assembly factor-like uncharacterized protein